MLKTINHIFLNCFLLLIAIQILNLSIDAVDFTPLKCNTGKAFNYYNSAIEYIAETISQKNIFPEFPKKPSKESQQFKHIGFKIFQPTNQNQQALAALTPANTFAVLLNEQYRFQFYKEINPPPPKV